MSIRNIQGSSIGPRHSIVANKPSQNIYAAQAPIVAYVRPSDWRTLPTVGNTEQKFVGLHAVFPDANFLALSAAGNYTVDWGDGTVENFFSGVQANHEYNYSTYDVGGSTLCSRGYKQAIVTVTPQSDQNLTNINLNLKNSTTGLQKYASGWLDILVSGPNLTSLSISGSSAAISLYYLEQAQLISTNSISSMSYLFAGCAKLQSIPVLTTSSTLLTNTNYMFQNCYSLQTIPLFNTVAVTSMNYMFQNCYSLQTVPLFNTAAVTSMSSMFNGCYSLQSIPLFNTAAVTNMNYMFNYCYSLQTVPALNVSAVTSSSNFSNIFNGCNNLAKISASQFKYTFSVASCKLSADRLNEIYTNLPTVTGQTITVTGNYGTTGDNPAIATAKGWTVTG